MWCDGGILKLEMGLGLVGEGVDDLVDFGVEIWLTPFTGDLIGD